MSDNPASILVVDHDLPRRRRVVAMLQPAGYLARGVATASEALAQFVGRKPDVLVLAGPLPGSDGIDLIHTLRGDPETAATPIILVTAADNGQAREDALHAGADEMLDSPVDPTQLLLRVASLLQLKALTNFAHMHPAIVEYEVQARSAQLQSFRAAMDATADVIVLVSRASMRYVEINSTAESMLGYSRGELLAMGPEQLEEGSAEALAATYDAIIAGHGSPDSSEVRLRCKDGSIYVAEAHRHAYQQGADWIIVGVLRDATRRKEAELRLRHLAHFDALTGLPNRALFHQTLRNTLEKAALGALQVEVLCLDLDQFKNINDMLGHAIGDELLRQFSERLTSCVRMHDTVGRLGGDEFALILVSPRGRPCARTVAGKIRDALRAPFDLMGHLVQVTASIGITSSPEDSSDPDDLLRYADTAMYRAKQAGRDTFRFFTAQMNVEMKARLDLETALRAAIENHEFVLHYQPTVVLHSGRVTGVEALLRWQRPGHGLVQPGDFIPLLEETGLIVPVGSWVIGTVCRQIATWAAGPIGTIQVSANVSGRQFVDGDLEGDVAAALASSGIAPDLLELEITESSLMANTARTIQILSNLRARGVRISIDDFGTGYSSLAYLRRFPINKVKIDIAFVREVTSNADDAAIVLAIIRMAHSLKLDVVAEGVENAAQLAYLRRHLCDYIQGYHFQPPLALHDLEQVLREGQALAVPDGGPDEPVNTLLLVEADPQRRDDLLRMLHPDGYRILCAPDANAAFAMLALHEAQVVICDQHLKADGGGKFLHRVREMYPDTCRIVICAHADPASIIESINCGSVHRFYVMPLDAGVVRENIRDAFRHHRRMFDAAGRSEFVQWPVSTPECSPQQIRTSSVPGAPPGRQSADRPHIALQPADARLHASVKRGPRRA